MDKFSAKKLLMSFLLFLFIIMLVSCSKQSHYEQGAEFLKQKQYTEAITEFRKVESGEKDFRLAQSKINYIQGYLSFNDSLFESAEVQLLKVVSDDEYYHDSQLMLDKIMQKKLALTRPPEKDTVVIKHEISTKQNSGEIPEGNIKAIEETDSKQTTIFVNDQKRLIERFESLYQSARTASVSSKQNYLSNMQSVTEKIDGLKYNAKQKDADALELKIKAIAWMNKRIEFINKLIKDNTASESNTSRSLREEGDKMYVGVKNQMNKFK